MKIDTAKYINDLMLDITKRLDDSLCVVKKELDAEEFRLYRYAVGNILGAILIDVLNNIYKNHPQIKPPQMDNEP